MQKRIELNSPRQNEVKMRDALIWASLMGLPVMLCACVLSASGAEACDGEYVGGMGNWSSSASWKNGAKAAGAGAILTVRAEEKNAAGYFLSLDEDATVGHIVRPADCEQPEGLSSPGYASVDVTVALCAESHADVSCGRLRFNTPNGGTPLALTLAGTNAIHGGMILVTPNMADTPVVIKGGTLVRQGCGGAADITIANFNTNATLTLDCDILGDVVAKDGSVKTNASASAGASWRRLRPAGPRLWVG